MKLRRALSFTLLTALAFWTARPLQASSQLPLARTVSLFEMAAWSPATPIDFHDETRDQAGFAQRIEMSGLIRSGETIVTGAPGDLRPERILNGVSCRVPTGSTQLTSLRPRATASVLPALQCFASSAEIAGTLVFQGPATADSTFIFQMGSGSSSEPTVLSVHGGREAGAIHQVVITVTPGNVAEPGGRGRMTSLRNPASPATAATSRPGTREADESTAALATFRFTAEPGAGGGRLDFINHVTGLDVEGPITDVQVVASNPDGLPRSVRFSGVCDDALQPCSFSVLVENRDDPLRRDDSGIALAACPAPAGPHPISSN